MGLECDVINVRELVFKGNDRMEQFNADLPVQIVPEYGIDEDGDYQLIVTAEIGKDSSRYPFYLKCQVVGVFSFDEELYEEEQEQLVMTDGLTIVMSFVRNYVYRITGDAGYDPLILPVTEIED